jgi:hypothetical protein
MTYDQSGLGRCRGFVGLRRAVSPSAFRGRFTRILIDWNWAACGISVAAVVISAALAWAQGCFIKRPGLDMGFFNHGGMWGDLVLLPIANAAIVAHLQPGIWIAVGFALGLVWSASVHVYWYRGDKAVRSPRSSLHSTEHMWPSRPSGSWWRDLSWAGWAHVFYVAGELTVLLGFLLFPMPDEAVAVVLAVFTLHVPLGLLQPRWFLTGEIATPRKQPLLLPLLATLWVVAAVKL